MGITLSQGGGLPELNPAILFLSDPVVTAVPFSVWVKFKLAADNETRMIWNVSRDPPGGGAFAGFHFGITPSGRIFCETRNIIGIEQGESASSYVPDISQTAGGAWGLSDRKTAYLNGLPGTTNTDPVSPPTSLDTTLIGAQFTSTVGTYNKMYAGCLAYLLVWNFELSDADFLALESMSAPWELYPENIICDLRMMDAATAGVNEAGDDFTTSSNPPDSEITDCDDLLFEEASSGSCDSGFELVYPPCVTKWTQCVRIVRRDDLTFRFTTLDRDLTFRDDEYLACNSLLTSAVQSFGELSEVGSSELAGILAAGAVDEADLYGGLFDDAFVEIWRVPYEGLDVPRRLGAGWVGKVSQSARGYKMEVLGPGARLDQRPIVKAVTPQCRWKFGDERCGIDVDALATAGVVNSGTNRGNFLASFAAEPIGSGTGEVPTSGALAAQYTDGRIVWLTGRNTGQTTETKSVDFTTGQVVLWSQTAHVPEAGDTFNLLPGCAQDFPTCVGIYDNGPAFGGFPYVPGQDAIIRSPNVKQS